MNVPPPTAKQARLFWATLSGLAVALILVLIVGTVWGLGQVLDKLSSVIWPVAVAVVLAYLLDPVVDFFERRRVPRPRAILLVFFIGLFIVLAVFGSIVPQVVVQTNQLARQIPEFKNKMTQKVNDWVTHPPALWRRFFPAEPTTSPADGSITNAPTIEVPAPPTNSPSSAIVSPESVSTNVATSTPGMNPTNAPPAAPGFDKNTVQSVTGWVVTALPRVGSGLSQAGSYLASSLGVLAGLALIPIYLFYLLLEKRAIVNTWTDYLPVRDSSFKEELVFVLGSINDYLIAFFRGQVLVALCDGVLYGIGFALIGLPYAFLIGVMAMVLTIIPFLGAIVTCGAALLIALVSYGDWQHPLLVLGVFAVVQGIEGYVLQPKIIGDRVGLHPMVIIIAIMTGTTLLGGVLGGLLAIPLAAVLRVVLARYVWQKRVASPVVLDVK